MGSALGRDGGGRSVYSAVYMARVVVEGLRGWDIVVVVMAMSVDVMLDFIYVVHGGFQLYHGFEVCCSLSVVVATSARMD